MKALIALLVVFLSFPASAAADRALAAMMTRQGVFLSWRLLESDAPGVAFDVYRVVDSKPHKLNSAPITETTDFLDVGGDTANHNWLVVANGELSNLAMKGRDGSIKIKHGHTTHARTIAVADLNGDGTQEFIAKFPATNIDPYYSKWTPSTGRYALTAFDRSGHKLWSYNMGWAIETGVWYAPYVVYDLDKDGKAELIVKAGDESLGQSAMRDETGRVTKGPEYLRVISGQDGATVLAQADWPDRNGFTGSISNHEPYNRQSRNFIAIAYLDGKTPHVIVSRGTYGKHKTAAYTYADGTLTRVWYWENVNPADGGDKALWGQGAHSLQAHDVDGDGKDEVVLGGLVLDDNGRPLYSLSQGHVDHVYIGDLNPSHPGKEIYWGAEESHNTNGIGMADAATGKLLWGVPWRTQHIHREGMCADISVTPGIECFGGEERQNAYWTFASDGAVIDDRPYVNLIGESIYWDADYQKEILLPSPSNSDLPLRYVADFPDRETVETLNLPADIASGERQYVVKLAIADVVGDWREELIAIDRNRILVYMSTVPATSRHVWLMQDHTYEMGVANSPVGYYQQPMLGRELRSPEHAAELHKLMESR